MDQFPEIEAIDIVNSYIQTMNISAFPNSLYIEWIWDAFCCPTSKVISIFLFTRFIWGIWRQVGETLLELILERADAEAETKGDSSSDEQQPTVQSASIEEKKIMNSEEEKVKLATPAVRHLAKTYGVNLADMVGSGKDGRIMKDDVLDYVASRESAIEDIQVIHTLLLLRVDL